MITLIIFDLDKKNSKEPLDSFAITKVDQRSYLSIQYSNVCMCIYICTVCIWI